MSRRQLSRRRAASAVAAILWLSSLAAPVAIVRACSCSWLGGTEEVAVQAIDQADVALIGTVTAANPVFGVGAMGFGGPNVRYSFAVERASVETGATIDVEAVDDGGGASCGFTFDVGDRWMVAASREGGTLSTHLCAGNTQLTGEDPGMAEHLLARLPFAPSPETDDGPWGAVVRVAPAAGGAGLVLAAIAVTVLAFRRRPRSG
jgi:hypothetical protein